MDEKAPRGGAGQAMPLVRLTLALRDAAEFEASHAGRLKGDGLFVTTPRPRAVGERVRLRVELVSGATAWTGEVEVTGAGHEGGRPGFWVRRPSGPAPTPPPLPSGVTPPPLPLRAAPRPAPQEAEEVEEAEEVDPETSFGGLLDAEEARAPTPTPTPTPLPVRATPPPLPPLRRSPSRPDLSNIFVEETGARPLPGRAALATRPGAEVEEEWLEGGLASMEVQEEEALEDLY